MFSPAEFRELVSGRRRGVRAACWRALLGAAQWPYRGVMRLRNVCYDAGWSRAHRVEVPVISVGNLTLGGTGKTPMVHWLARWFLAHGVRAAVISRGYKARPGALNDEALELAAALPHVPHLQNPDRVAAAREATGTSGAQLIILDDAFQHRRIARDLDLVLLDALEPFGFGHVFPRGTLREPVAGLRRADVVALSRSDTVGADERARIRAAVQRWAPHALWLELVHRPLGLRNAAGEQQPLAGLTGRPVAAFCGIGNPAGFRHTLESSGCRLVEFRVFPDHHPYAAADVAALEAWAGGLGDMSAIVCTPKDLVKINRPTLGPHPLWAVQIELEIVAGQEALETRLRALRT